MSSFISVLAQAATGGQEPGIFQMVVLFAPLLLIWYFLLIRPQQKQAQEKEKMVKALQKGDKVILSSGIHGSVHEVQETILVVEVADKVRLRVQRDAVQALATPPAKAA